MRWVVRGGVSYSLIFLPEHTPTLSQDYYSLSAGTSCSISPIQNTSLCSLYLSNAIGGDFFLSHQSYIPQPGAGILFRIRSDRTRPLFTFAIGIGQYPSSYLFILIQVINFLLQLPVDYNCCKSILNHIIIILPVAMDRFILCRNYAPTAVRYTLDC